MAFILHLVPGKFLLAIGLSCYAIAALLGAAQPLNTIYWAMSFPAMSTPQETLRLMEVIGVIGADVTYLVTSLFAATSVSESQQSIASGIVATTAAVCGSIYNAIAAALISGTLPLPLVVNFRHRRQCNRTSKSRSSTINKGVSSTILVFLWKCDVGRFGRSDPQDRTTGDT